MVELCLGTHPSAGPSMTETNICSCRTQVFYAHGRLDTYIAQARSTLYIALGEAVLVAVSLLRLRSVSEPYVTN
jgi:hypothetical protein